MVCIKVSNKKNSPSIEERRGRIDPGKCDARIWKAKVGAGTHVGYDNIQCSSKKYNGGCLCKKHTLQQEQGKLWLGLITEKRPENPMGPPDSKEKTLHRWSTDEDGNEISFTKKTRKKRMKKEKEVKQDINDMDLDETEKVIANFRNTVHALPMNQNKITK